MKHINTNTFVHTNEQGFPVVRRFNDVHVLSGTTTKNINAVFTKYGLIVLCDRELYIETYNGWNIQRLPGTTSKHFITSKNDTIIIVRDQTVYSCSLVHGFLNMYPVYHCPQEIMDCIALENSLGAILTPTMVGTARVTNTGLHRLKYAPISGSMLVPDTKNRFYVVSDNRINTYASTGILTELEEIELPFKIEKYFIVNGRPCFYGDKKFYYNDYVYNADVDVVGIELLLGHFNVYYVEDGVMRVRKI